MNPYEANPAKIPADDLYRNEPFFGRYHVQPDDFQPDLRYVLSKSVESVEYWRSVLQQCNRTNMLYENVDEDGRDVFALVSMIVKSSHMRTSPANAKSTRDYSFADANEVEAVKISGRALAQSHVQVPRIYYAGKIDAYDVLVQERIPGVALCVAWRYLSQEQKISFKQQARSILRLLHQVRPPTPICSRSYVVPDPDPVRHRHIQNLEYEILSTSTSTDPDCSLAHNDLTTSNIIVDKDKIIGIVDWEMAGWFGIGAAAQVHSRIRGPKRESYAPLLASGSISEDQLQDFLFWEDLYDGM